MAETKVSNMRKPTELIVVSAFEKDQLTINRTAEDLTTTQRRLARYEALLNEIMPHVSPNVKAMIEEAKDLVRSVFLVTYLDLQYIRTMLQIRVALRPQTTST